MFLFVLMLAQAIYLRLYLYPKYEKNWMRLLGNGSGLAAAMSIFAWNNPFSQSAWAGLTVIGWLVVLIWFNRDKPSGTARLRGQALAPAEDVAKEIKREKLKTRLEIGGVPIPIEVEDRGFLLAGSPGTGKSQAITRILDTLQVEGHRAVIADASGIFYSRYSSPDSVLFNPFDSRSVSWSPLSDIHSAEDCAAMARSIIPDGIGDSSEWNGYAQTLLEAVLEHVWEAGGANGDILRLATSASADELRKTLPPGPVMALLDKDASRMLGSIRAIVGRYLKPFTALDQSAGGGAFSFRKFITESDGWIFITYKQSQRDAMRPLIACALDIASHAVLDLPPATGNRAEQRRTWFILDEFPLLGRMQTIETLLTNGSKHGSAVIAGIQTIAQVRDAYGREKSQTILSTLGTWLCLRVSDAETAEYMSKYLGDEEVRRVIKSGGESSKTGEFGNSTSENWAEQYTTQRVVMPSELQNLPDLCGYLNIAGPLPACPVRLPLAEQRAPIAEAFVAAPPRVRQPAGQSAIAEADDQADQHQQPEPADVPFSL